MTSAALVTQHSVLRAVRRLPQLVLVGLLRAYQYGISPMTGPSCRFYPSCSSYALTAVQRHGALRGSWLALRRLGRCHPWAAGGVDDVPPARHQPSCPDHGPAERARSSTR
ncbi:membrane protein insertion efficiency factor YidD [Actinotalea subterranea]|uniref:membrane protein insertion efficiency factor YidD n=1 Tax=Actinotalea subterranea TaxID=2607497 RepID=UPI0011ED1F6D|nr:membrane protein insertion efficiency factor YidD [Actinotalea subterranea]